MSEPRPQLQTDPGPPARPRILLVTHVVFCPPAAGNEQRIDRLLRWLTAAGYEVVLLLTTRPSRAQAAALRARKLLVHVIAESLPQRLARRLVSLRRRREPAPHPVERSLCPERVQRAVARLVERYEPLAVLAEYVWMSRALCGLPASVLRIIDCHDLFSRRAEKVGALGIADSLACTPEEEAVLLRRGDVILSIQPDEGAALAALVPQHSVLCVGIDYEVCTSSPHAPLEPDAPIVLCVASDNPANRDGVRWLLTQAWPLIRARHPRAQLELIGRIAQSFAPEMPIPGVTLRGVVADLAAAYARAAVVINPVRAGTGLKIKSVEALAHGRPLVSLPNGVEGMGPPEALPAQVAADYPELAQKVCRLLDDPEQRAALSRQAVAYARQYLSRDVVYRPLAEALDHHAQELLALSRARSGSAAPLRVIALMVRHGTQKYPRALVELEALYARILDASRGDSYSIVILENDASELPPRAEGAAAPNVRIVAGDNAAYEFSAWDRALANYPAELARADLLHFVTDAFTVPYCGYLERLSRAQLALCAASQTALGHLDSYPAPIELFGQRSRAWLRTCFFFLSPRALATLRRHSGPHALFSVVAPQQFFTEDAAAPFRPDAPLSPRYRRYLGDWLNGRGLGHGAWHSRFARTPETLQRFRQKARAILNEHALSIRLRQAGIATVDITWLKAQLDRGVRAPAVPLATPPLAQIAVRTRLLGQALPDRIRLVRRLRAQLRKLSEPRRQVP